MISVCMATYNGEKFLYEQLKSILSQLDWSDEVIVVDDCSTDKTYEMLSKINDSRLKIFRNNKNEVHIKAFEKSINLSSGDYIFLSDQDDIWIDNRVKLMCGELASKKFVSSNYDLIDKFGKPIKETLDVALLAVDSNKWLRNIYLIFRGRSNYFGCAIAFHKSLKTVVMPFPTFVESHDIWIATAANLLKSVSHIESSTLLRRIHGANLSVVRRSLSKKLKARFIFLKSILILICRIFHVEK